MLRRALEGCFGAALTAVALCDGQGGGTGSGGSGAAGVEGMVGMAGIDGEEIGYEGWPCGVMFWDQRPWLMELETLMEPLV